MGGAWIVRPLSVPTNVTTVPEVGDDVLLAPGDYGLLGVDDYYLLAVEQTLGHVGCEASEDQAAGVYDSCSHFITP